MMPELLALHVCLLFEETLRKYFNKFKFLSLVLLLTNTNSYWLAGTSSRKELVNSISHLEDLTVRS